MRGGEVKSACSFGRGVNGGLVAGDSITQLVMCERMRWRLGADIVRVVVIACGSKAGGNSLDRHSAGRNRVSLKRSSEFCRERAVHAQAFSAPPVRFRNVLQEA